MKISIRKIQTGLANSLRRFPFQILVAAFATIVQFAFIKNNYSEEENYIRILLTCNLVFVLSLAIDLYQERHTNYTFGKKTVSSLVYIGVGVILFNVLNYTLYEVNIFRFFALS
ncbi:MAG: hypothetical protein DI598_02035, partial [Pseudopedobacter saltans]